LDKTHLEPFVAETARHYAVFVPVLKKRKVVFAPFLAPPLNMAAGPSYESIKRFLLPDGDPVVSYDLAAGAESGRIFSTADAGRQTVLIGVRPCDARSVALNANTLLHDPCNPHADSCFQRRKEQLLIVGLACLRPCREGFCRAVGGDPSGTEGMDLLLTDAGDFYSVTVLTEAGEQLASGMLMRDAAPGEEKPAGSPVSSSSPAVADDAVRPPAAAVDDLFSLPLWEELARRCLNCGICTHLCPTCTCFDLLDHAANGSGYRFRVWDSCMLPLFTQQASGHNPRKNSRARIRQRFMHKLVYYPEKFGGQVSCVGCGRCVRYCPVNIDIREIAEQLVLMEGGTE